MWKGVKKQMRVLGHDHVADEKELILLTIKIQVVNSYSEVSIFWEDFREGDDR